MSHKKKHTVYNSVSKIKLDVIRQLPPRQNDQLSYSPLPITWLISSLIFFAIANWVTPLFWQQLDHAEVLTELTTVHIILGVSGIVIYVLEPIIWNNNVYAAEEEIPHPRTNNPPAEKNELLALFSFIVGVALRFITVIPYVALMIFKPVFRAMILYTSFSYLNLVSGPGSMMWLFNIVVGLDILFYYLGMIFPKWKMSPVHLAARLFFNNSFFSLKKIQGLLLILYSALIYNLILNVVHYSYMHHPATFGLYELAWYWLMLTIYMRMSFLPDDFDAFEVLKTMSWKTALLNIFIFGISFLSFVWPFYFN